MPRKKVTPKIFPPLIATIVCMVMIFLFSAQPAEVSAGNSRALVGKVVYTTAEMIGKKWSQQQLTEVVDSVNAVARELMHAIVYFVLGIFVQLTVLAFISEKLLSGLVTFNFCIFYGMTDEVHQLFVPGRAFQISDLIMDAAGAAAAVLLVLFIHTVKYERKKR